MSIASEITRIKGNIADAYEACANKGGTMPPYDAEVEYIESTGNVATSVPCWIDTGIEADRTTVFEVTFAFTQVSPAVVYSGAMGQGYRSGSRFSIAGDDYSNTKWASAYNGWYIHSKDKDTLKHTFKLDAPNSKAYVDDDAVTIGTSYTSEGGSIALFCRNCDGGTSQNWGCNGKMYGSKIWKNGALVRDFIPVRVGDVGYLYDKVSGELFGNKGTGSFALGADVRLAQTSANLAGAIESIPQGGWVKPADWVDLHKVLADYPAPEGYPYAVAMLLTDTFSDAIPNGNNSGAYRTSSNPDTVVTRNSGDRFLFDPTKHINHTHWLIQYFATSDARAELWGDDNYKRSNTILWVVGSEGANVRCSARFGINLQAIECDTLMIGGYYYDTCRSLQKVKAHKVKAEVSNMTSAFNSCALLREIECDEFDITSANVNNLGYMFYGSGLVKAPEMDTSNVLNFSLMLAGCGSLVSVPQYDYSNATEVVNNIWGMCALKELPDVMNMPNLTSNPNYLVNVNRCACKNVPTHLTINKSFSLFNGGTWWSDGFKRDTFAAFTDGEVTGGMVFNMNEVSGLTMTVNSAMKALFTTDEQEAIETTLAGKGWNISW